MNTIKITRAFLAICFLFVFVALVTEAVSGATYTMYRNETYSVLPTNKTYTFPLGLNVTGNEIINGNLTANYLYGYLNASYIQNPYWILLTSEPNLNVNSSVYWDGETSQADLNVNYSTSCGSAGTASYATEAGEMNWTGLKEYPATCPANSYITQLNDSVTCTSIDGSAHVHAGENITSGTIDFARLPNLTNKILSDVANVTGAVPVGQCMPGDYVTETTTIGVSCSTPSGVTDGHSHSAPYITTGTFGAGDYIFPANLTVQGTMGINVTTGCVYLPSGGSLCGNSTCTVIKSPNGLTILQACNT